MKGPPPKPTALRLIQGNPSGRPINADEPEPEGDIEAPPPSLTRQQKRLWRETVANAPAGLVRKLDYGTFLSYIVNLDQLISSNKTLAREGLVVTSASGEQVQNPHAFIFNRASAQMLKAAAELGFTPSSRSRVKVTGKNKPKSAFGKLKASEV